MTLRHRVHDSRIAGVVLAGGQSSRMGRNKALLTFKGKPLIEHMMNIVLKAGVERVWVSGEVPGYDGIPDAKADAGPARAIVTVLQTLDEFDAIVFVPVDMPLLKPEMLHLLMQFPHGAFISNNPLPVCIPTATAYPDVCAVHALLEGLEVPAVSLPSCYVGGMRNANTLAEWREVVRA
ncbi:MAG: molybdenum cofactor guanylyltransferase [Gammaproteobacteria bacterium]